MRPKSLTSRIIYALRFYKAGNEVPEPRPLEGAGTKPAAPDVAIAKRCRFCNTATSRVTRTGVMWSHYHARLSGLPSPDLYELLLDTRAAQTTRRRRMSRVKGAALFPPHPPGRDVGRVGGGEHPPTPPVASADSRRRLLIANRPGLKGRGG